MKRIFEEMSFGNKFLNAMGKIYTTQNATIRINNELTGTFPVLRGTRQGCPISPLIFILILEVLLKNIQNNEDIKGIKIKDCHFKYRAFADDVVFFIQDPEENISILLQEIDKFGPLAGF